MSDASPVGFPEAARRLGVPVRVLRRAIRAGRIPAPPHPGALAALPADWLVQACEAVAESPKALTRAASRKVAPFARYEGTSAWRKYRNRVRDYVRFRAAAH